MKYKCIALDTCQTWLSPEKAYEAEVVVSPVEFSGGAWLYVKRADDGQPCYAKASQFISVKQGFDKLGV